MPTFGRPASATRQPSTSRRPTADRASSADRSSAAPDGSTSIRSMIRPIAASSAPFAWSSRIARPAPSRRGAGRPRPGRRAGDRDRWMTQSSAGLGVAPAASMAATTSATAIGPPWHWTSASTRPRSSSRTATDLVARPLAGPADPEPAGRGVGEATSCREAGTPDPPPRPPRPPRPGRPRSRPRPAPVRTLTKRARHRRPGRGPSSVRSPDARGEPEQDGIGEDHGPRDRRQRGEDLGIAAGPGDPGRPEADRLPGDQLLDGADGPPEDPGGQGADRLGGPGRRGFAGSGTGRSPGAGPSPDGGPATPGPGRWRWRRRARSRPGRSARR